VETETKFELFFKPSEQIAFSLRMISEALMLEEQMLVSGEWLLVSGKKSNS